jgi:ATP-dependent Lon protease
VADLGLFPLDLVLVPGERIPLHIFEPRYRELMRECLDTSGEFGLIYQQGAALSAVGTRATVDEVLETFPDGRFNVAIGGTTRFRLVEQTEGRSFLTAQVDEFEDIPDPATRAEVDACLNAYVQAMAGVEVGTGFATEGLAFALACEVPLPNSVKQELLELPSERERILRLTDALLGDTGTEIRTREIERRASGNGKVHNA